MSEPVHSHRRFPIYRGFAGYDLDAVAAGQEEMLDGNYLRHRIRATEYLAQKVAAAGVGR